MDYALSDTDVRYLCGNPPNVKGFKACAVSIIPYENLEKVENIDRIVSPSKPCILLYQESHNSGHWVALFRRGKTLCFFDPYGVKPDMQQTLMSSKVRKRFYESPHLARLLYECPYSIDYNQYPFQADGDDIATCGRHCVVRLWNRGKSTEMYGKCVEKVCKTQQITPDELVFLLTN